MDFYLMDPEGPQLHLPVNPEKVTIRINKQYETVNIISLGEVDFPQGEKPMEVSFSSFFPREYDSSYCRYPDLPTPEAAVKQLTSWLNHKKPIQLLITTTNVNTLVTIVSCNTTYTGGEPGDIYYDLTCRSWREVKVKSISNSPTLGAALPGKTRPDTKPSPGTYLVRTGDSLYKIAKAELKNWARWEEIYNLNKVLIGPNPHLLIPGQKLVLPDE